MQNQIATGSTAPEIVGAPLTSDDLDALRQLRRFARKYFFLYLLLAVFLAAIVAGMAATFIYGLSDDGFSSGHVEWLDVVTALVALAILGSLFRFSWSVMRLHRFNLATLKQDIDSGKKTVVAGVTVPQDPCDKRLTYALANRVLEIRHPLIAKGYSLKYFACLNGRNVEIHYADHSRLLLSAVYTDVPENDVTEAPLTAKQVAILKPTHRKHMPRAHRMTRGVVTEISRFTHPLPFPVGSASRTHVRLSGTEFGGVDAKQVELGKTFAIASFV